MERRGSGLFLLACLLFLALFIASPLPAGVDSDPVRPTEAADPEEVGFFAWLNPKPPVSLALIIFFTLVLVLIRIARPRHAYFNLTLLIRS